ncbi:TRAP-like protein, putative, fragment [Plasmodium gallinaceum]|uniref:TRAP-like protein, putative n=1 Tax=Plasmodium gallinaceum TaxID=5849 RepID=A0A1J1GZH7_PLAGA|nr:TRAP-like protein, putative, fragment [Plasmodium gallinaceum]CRG97974.1 TRAP-like protein, putative, fragment [Plasmodium gallinaceum]
MNNDDKEETFHSDQNKNDKLTYEHQTYDNIDGGKQKINEETKEHGKQEISEETEEHGKHDKKMKNDDVKEEEIFHSDQNNNGTLTNKHQTDGNIDGEKQEISEETEEHGKQDNKMNNDDKEETFHSDQNKNDKLTYEQQSGDNMNGEKQEISEETEEHGKQDKKMKNDVDKEETFHSYQNKNDTLINEHHSGDNMNGGKQKINEETKEHGKQEIDKIIRENGKHDKKMNNDDDKEEEIFHFDQNNNDTVTNKYQTDGNIDGEKQEISEETEEHGKQDKKMKNDVDKEETFHSYQNKNDTLINEHHSGDNMNGGKQVKF